MTRRARFERFLSPGLGWCYRCGRPWKTYAKRKTGPNSSVQLRRLRWWGLVGVEPHTTAYTESRGCFPLCEKCWAALTPAERLPFYDALVDEWIRQVPENEREYRLDRDVIASAVLAES